MSPQRNSIELLQEATEAARQGDRAEARQLLQELLNEEPNNVKALTLLYRVSDSITDKRQALEQILAIDPGNQRAQEALDKLGGATLRGKAPIVEDEEVAPGISRRQLTLVLGSLAAIVVVVLGGAFAFITANNAARENEFATRTAVIEQETQIAMLETGMSMTETQAFVDATATFFAINSPTPTPTQTRIGPPTLPVEYTATPTFTPDVPPTALPFPPLGAGVLIVAGGPDLLNDGYHHIYTIPAQGGRPNLISEERTRYPHAQALDRILFTLYSRFTFEYSLASLNMASNATEPEMLAERWQMTQQGMLLRPDQAKISNNRRYIVFVANDSRDIDSLFILDLEAPIGNDPLTRLTADDYNYSFPAWSSDDQRVVAVRTDNRGGVDLFEINVNSKALNPITTDGDNLIETMPRYHPSANELVYAARPADSETYDIYIRPADGSGQGLNITRNEGVDDSYPAYSPDGRYIVYSSNRTQGYNLYVYDREDGSLYQITEGVDDYFAGAWLE